MTEPEEGSGPTWRGEREFSLQMAFDVINFHNALPGAGSNGLRFSHLQSIIKTQFGQDLSSAGIEAFWRKIVDEPEAFPPEVWDLSLRSNLNTLGKDAAGFVWRLRGGTLYQ